MTDVRKSRLKVRRDPIGNRRHDRVGVEEYREKYKRAEQR